MPAIVEERAVEELAIKISQYTNEQWTHDQPQRGEEEEAQVNVEVFVNEFVAKPRGHVLERLPVHRRRHRFVRHKDAFIAERVLAHLATRTLVVLQPRVEALFVNVADRALA